MCSILNANVLRLAELVKSGRFPGDRRIGYMHRELDAGDLRMGHIYTIADQLWYHHGCSYFLLQKEFKRALEEGEITPALFASVYEWAYKDLKEGRDEMKLCVPADKRQINSYNVCPVIKPWDRNKDTVFVNKCREEIGLCSLEHFNKKKEYATAHNMILLFGMFSIY